MIDTNCEGCFYALPAIGDDEIEVIMSCRRYPPMLMVLDGVLVQMFPDRITSVWGVAGGR